MEEEALDEAKPAAGYDPTVHQIDVSKLSPSPEPEEMEDPGIDCAICYEPMAEICKKAEDEGKGGISGSLAIYACEQAACGGSKSLPYVLSRD
jgi:hypothetical protein